MTLASTRTELHEAPHGFYRDALLLLQRSGVPFLVGGAFALRKQTGIDRLTKDIDIFVRPPDVRRALAVCQNEGFDTDLTFPHWLAKVRSGEDLLDIIFSSANGIACVDDAWFEHAVEAEVLGLRLPICPPEEMIWSKAFILERERYDGADIAHILLANAQTLDWQRLLHRFGGYWHVLLVHLTLFGFTYPSERDRVPPALMHLLLDRLRGEIDSPPSGDRVCRGTLLSWGQYLVDVQQWGFADARRPPYGALSAEVIERWTVADKS